MIHGTVITLALVGLHVWRIRVLRQRWEWDALGRVQIAVRSAIEAEHRKRLKTERDAV